MHRLAGARPSCSDLVAPLFELLHICHQAAIAPIYCYTCLTLAVTYRSNGRWLDGYYQDQALASANSPTWSRVCTSCVVAAQSSADKTSQGLLSCLLGLTYPRWLGGIRGEVYQQGGTKAPAQAVYWLPWWASSWKLTVQQARQGKVFLAWSNNSWTALLSLNSDKFK